jgi:hypothetical protein
MSCAEFMSEMQHFDGSGVDDAKSINAILLDANPLELIMLGLDLCTPDSKAATFDAGGLIEGVGSWDAGGLLEGPVGTHSPGRWKIRSGDQVKIAANSGNAECTHCHSALHSALTAPLERFWVDVLSVTVFGIVTGVPLSQLHFSEIGPNQLVYFSWKSVIGVVHGQFWHEEAVDPGSASSPTRF